MKVIDTLHYFKAHENNACVPQFALHGAGYILLFINNLPMSM